jgi:hypothetical protein
MGLLLIIAPGGWVQQIFLSLTIIFNIQHFKSQIELGLHSQQVLACNKKLLALVEIQLI